MFCKKCGYELNGGEKFCKRCGQAVQSGTANLNIPPILPNQQTPPPKKTGRIVALVTALVLVVGACSGVFVFRNEILGLFSKTKTFDENNVGEIYCAAVDSGHIGKTENGCMYADNEVLLVATEGTSYKEIEKLAKNYDAEIVGWIEQTGDYQLKFSETYTMEEIDGIAQKLEAEKNVDSVSMNYISEIQEDSIQYGQEWSGETWDEQDHAGSNWGLEAIHCLSAWDLFEENTTKGDAIRIGLIDNGFDTSHDDLGYAEVFYENGNNGVSSSDKAHGTHVSGTMAAKSNNEEGICGVYPYGDGNLYAASWKNSLNLKENCTSSIYAKCCFAELILRNVKIINCSYGGDSNLVVLKNEEGNYEKSAECLEQFFLRLLDKGYDFVIVCSAGNDSNQYYTKLKVDPDGNVAIDKWDKATYDENGEYFNIVYSDNLYYVDKNDNYYKINGLDMYNLVELYTMIREKKVYYFEQADATYNNELTLFTNDELKNRVIVVGAIGEEKNNGKNLENILFDKREYTSKDASGYHISSFSDLGDRVDVLAPGEDIFSTVPNNRYEDGWSGTSMAAPHVSGVAAMVWTVNPGLSGSQVKEIICKSADWLFTIGKNGDGYIESSYKLVDANKAIQKALDIETTEESTEPQNGGVLCYVVNKEDENTKIENAKVTMVNVDTNEEYTATTDSSGYFELFLPEGKYTLTVTADGYEDYTWPGDNTNFQNPIEVKNNGVNYLDDWIKLTPKSTLPDLVQAVLDNESTWTQFPEEYLNNLNNSKVYSWFQDLDMDGTPEFIVGPMVSGAHAAHDYEVWTMENRTLTKFVLSGEDYWSESNSNLVTTWLNIDDSEFNRTDDFISLLYQDKSSNEYLYIFPEQDGVSTETYQYLKYFDCTNKKNFTSSGSLFTITTMYDGGEVVAKSYSTSNGEVSAQEFADSYNSFFANLQPYDITVKDISYTDYRSADAETKQSLLLDSYNAWSYQENSSAKLPLADEVAEIKSNNSTSTALTQDQLNSVRKALGVPDDLKVTIEQGTSTYWDAGDVWLTPVSIYDSTGACIASAQVNSETAELVKEIFMYSDTAKNTSYLEEIPIIESDQYAGNEGDSFVYPIGKHKNTRGTMCTDGNSYEHGIECWLARWNYKAESSWAYSTFNLNKKYKTLQGACRIIQSYNTTDFDVTLEFQGDGTILKSYHLTPDALPIAIDVDVSNCSELKIYVYDNTAKEGGTSFGLVDMRLS